MADADRPSPASLARLRTWARATKRDTYAIALAARDRRTPWYARAVALGVVAYALSPIDLIPDPIPVLGYLDDLILVPLGLALAIRLIPPAVLAEHRAAAERRLADGNPRRRLGAAFVIAAWLTLAALAALLLARPWR